jgi:hypothetical protein
MHKPSNRVVEQIASILIAVMFVSIFSTYIQSSVAQQAMQTKDAVKIQMKVRHSK